MQDYLIALTAPVGAGGSELYGHEGLRRQVDIIADVHISDTDGSPSLESWFVNPAFAAWENTVDMRERQAIQRWLDSHKSAEAFDQALADAKIVAKELEIMEAEEAEEERLAGERAAKYHADYVHQNRTHPH